MTELSEAVVGDARTSSFAWELLEDLTDVGNRMAGQDGERRGAELVRETFDSAGLDDPEIVEFEIPGWWRGESTLRISGPLERTHEESHEVIALPGTPADTVSGPLVDVGTGSYDDFADAEGELQGAIVMASSESPSSSDRWIHRMEKYVNAADRGAAGFVFRNHIEGALPPTGEIGYHERPGPIPAVGVSAEVGDRLARLAADHDGRNGDGGNDEGGNDDGGNDAPVVELDVDCRNEPSTSRNVRATIGPAEADREVLVTAHVDGHDISDGANDNAAGCAAVAGIGRLLARAADDLDCRVRLATFGAEEIGLWGAYHCAETLPKEGIKCVVNLDGACNSRNLRVGTNGFATIGDVFESVTDDYDAPLSTGDTISPHGDQWAFVQEGIPAVMVSTTSEQSGRGWGHTHADTLDKLDPRDLTEVVTLVTEAVYRLADDDVEPTHTTSQRIREKMDDGYIQELEVGGRLPDDWD
ncbi:peptidase M28 [Halalkaliarchaeum desulfuricum]|uniref:Carboxypeptidase Q n=1 Tax=Halalkaliarchaeum desulfuricum TaxID=2055893 RepID=A0A343TP01_9EURY|nr:M28 family peptidase [Halalkaliarchaeum desulfuricum]AUX10823.1 peptidase M28 [Halalkaliarchaeum desulfuricum]